MHQFPITFTYKGTEYKGEIYPDYSSMWGGKPILFEVVIAGNDFGSLTRYNSFYFAADPSLSEVLGELIVVWWDSATAW